MGYRKRQQMRVEKTVHEVVASRGHGSGQLKRWLESVPDGAILTDMYFFDEDNVGTEFIHLLFTEENDLDG